MLAQTEVRVRLIQRPHRLAWQPRRGRPARPPWHVSGLVPTSCGPCPPRSWSTPNQTPPQSVVSITNGKIIKLARRRRAVRPPLRRAAPPPPNPRLPGRHPRPGGGLGVAEAPARCGCDPHPAGVLHPAGHRRHPLRSRARRPGGLSGDPVRPGRQRGAAGRRRRSSGWGTSSTTTLVPENHVAARRTRIPAGPPHQHERLAGRGRDRSRQ